MSATALDRGMQGIAVLRAVMVASALVASATANHFSSRRVPLIDCHNPYKTSFLKLQDKQLSSDRLVALHHWALRVYDACQTGDLIDATLFFENLDRLIGRPVDDR